MASNVAHRHSVPARVGRFGTGPARPRYVPGTRLGSVGHRLVGRVRRGRVAKGLGRDLGALEMLVRWAVVTLRQRGPLARLALPRGGATTRDAAVECPGLDLLLDEGHGRGDALLHGPGHLRLS